MTQIYLVRHGETDWNLQKRIQGSTDIPLNDTGRAQAAATGRLLASREWDAIITSPLSRAAETAGIIAEAVGLPTPEVLDTIVERHYGEAEGLDHDEIEAMFPDNAEVPGRETREAVAARVIPAIVQLAERHPGQSIIVVSHGGVIRAVLGSVDPESPHVGATGQRGEPIRNGSVHSFRHTDGTLDLIAFDDPIHDRSLDLATEDIEDQNALEERDSGVLR